LAEEELAEVRAMLTEMRRELRELIAFFESKLAKAS
jgi:hypothetical protein